MNDVDASTTLRDESLEGRRSHELVRDEDVLSLELQHALETIGTGVGFVVAIALLFSHVPRAGRLLAEMHRRSSATGAGAP